jgi:2-oxoacid dehydrogenases acyltransferase (catalytic domain)
MNAQRPRYLETEWPVIRNALTTFLDMQRPHTVHGFGEVDVTEPLAAIRRLERELRVAISFHAFALYCMVQAAMQNPTVVTYRRGRKLITFEDIDVLTPVDKRLPSGVRIPVAHIVRGAQNKSLAEINWELRRAVKAPDLPNDRVVRMRRRAARLPAFARRWISRRMQRDPFLFKRLNGTIGLTNVQSHGFTNTMYALPPAIHTFGFAIGNTAERLKLDESGKVTSRKVMCIGSAADHDILDGMGLARFAYLFTQLVESGAGLDDSFVAETRRFMQGDKSDRIHTAQRS